MMFEHYHWKKAKAKNQPYKFKVHLFDFKQRINLIFPFVYEPLFNSGCWWFFFFSRLKRLLDFVTGDECLCCCSGMSTWTRTTGTHTISTGLFTSRRIYLCMLFSWGADLTQITCVCTRVWFYFSWFSSFYLVHAWYDCISKNKTVGFICCCDLDGMCMNWKL